MNFLYSDGPIIACSTSTHTHAALAVVRISGFNSLDIFNDLIQINSSNLVPRKVYYTKLLDEGSVVDDICLSFFEAPHSYNGENILELSVHGNTLNVERILDLFLQKGGCRLAAPGEFSYRALKNKKLTLSQIEGLDLFLNANSGYALEQGHSLLNGNLHSIYHEIYELFLRHKASLELSIDFAEDIGEETAKSHFVTSLKDFSNKFQTLARRVRPMEHNLIRPEIILAGLPNSGKSSLFNFFLAEDRAIVSPIAGTTRDYLSESLVINGVKYRLIDTAGLRNSEDLIEVEGVKRTRSKMKNAFYSILLINPLEESSGIEELLSQQFDIMFFTHADLPGFLEAKKLLLDRYPQLGSIGAIDVKNLDRHWEENLFNRVNNKYLKITGDKPILLERHKFLILKGFELLTAYENSTTYECDVAVLSSELNMLGHCISELIGIISPDEVLNSIFSNFCIGK